MDTVIMKDPEIKDQLEATEVVAFVQDVEQDETETTGLAFT